MNNTIVAKAASDLYAFILRQIEREAEAVPQFNITSEGAREVLAQNLYGNIAMWQQEQVKPLIDGLEILANPVSYQEASTAIPVKAQTIAQVALEHFYAKKAGLA